MVQVPTPPQNREVAYPLADSAMDLMSPQPRIPPDVIVPGHPRGVAVGTIYFSRAALVAARVHTALDRPVALIHENHPQVASVVDRGGHRSAAADGSCMLEFRAPRSSYTPKVSRIPPPSPPTHVFMKAFIKRM